MSVVYLIMTGEYSAKQCVGYCTTEDKALEYCAVQNGTQGRWRDEYYYYTCECLDDAIQGNADLGVTVTFRFVLKQSGWNGLENAEQMPSIRHSIEVYPESSDGRSIIIRLWQKEYDPEKARKIVQDALYKWLAEEEEMSKSKYERLEE